MWKKKKFKVRKKERHFLVSKSKKKENIDLFFSVFLSRQHDVLRPWTLSAGLASKKEKNPREFFLLFHSCYCCVVPSAFCEPFFYLRARLFFSTWEEEEPSSYPPSFFFFKSSVWRHQYSFWYSLSTLCTLLGTRTLFHFVWPCFNWLLHNQMKSNHKYDINYQNNAAN